MQQAVDDLMDEAILAGAMAAAQRVNNEETWDIEKLRKLDHPNIMRFLGTCRTQTPCCCIVMEFCPSGHLYDLLRTGESILPARLSSWSKQIVAGMRYLHRNEIIHKNLRSCNILLGRSDSIKIRGFGPNDESYAEADLTPYDERVAWMAPEQIRNETCSYKVDVWSYGIVTWEMLTGEVPYEGLSTSRIVEGVASERLRLPIPASYPQGYAALFEHCWSLRPSTRPSFRNIEMFLIIAESELEVVADDEYMASQQTWKEVIRRRMKQIRSVNSSSPNVCTDLTRRNDNGLNYVRDRREIRDTNLAELANNLFIE